ncbi:MAG: hypothetical protein HY521_07140 [Proteobacteria bacterium]|nr:hypothetical protein [Pseudomonadota bacterium]
MTMTTEERLENLERELSCAKRRSRRLLTGAALCLGIGLAAYALVPGPGLAQRGAGAPKEVRAGAFVLVDDNGMARAALFVVKDGPKLGLYDENDKPRAMLSVSKDGPTLGLYDENDKPRAGLTVTEVGPTLVLNDKNGEPRAGLAVTEVGPGLVLNDENGKPRATLGVSKDGPGLALFDKTNKPVWSTPRAP